MTMNMKNTVRLLTPHLVAIVAIVAWTPMVLPARAVANDSAHPNIVLILADDLGYGDIKSFGEDRCQIETPHFDRLAKEGMRFTSAYSICSVCVPSRIAIMTGRYPWRFQRGERGGPWGFLGLQMPVEQDTIARLLKAADYRTGYVGKWHLGTTMHTKDGKVQGVVNVDYTRPLKAGPSDFGFDETFILPGSLDMFPYAYVHNGQWVGSVTAQKGWSAFNRVGPAAEDFEDTAVLDTFCQQAESFIASSAELQANKPFFLYLALTAPHTPLSPSKEFDGKSRLGVYGDFVMETDNCVGRVLAALDRHGIANNTIVIATSDHGPASYAGRRRKATEGQLAELEQDGHYASGVFRGSKFSIYEGGFRVPYVVRWPKRVKPGTSCDQLIALPDLAATLAELTEQDLAPSQAPDSFSFMPLLVDPATDSARKSVVVQATRAFAIREGDWKLVFAPGAACDDRWLIPDGHEKSWREALARYGGTVRNHEQLLVADFIQLFNLKKDPSETINLAQKHPERVATLHHSFKELVANGRSTPGEVLTDTLPNVRAFRAVPNYVFGK
jgi:arylsulfatase A-like enzyme